MNIVVKPPHEIINDIMVCTEKMRERQDVLLCAELAVQIPALVDNLPDKDPRIDFFKSRLTKIKDEVPLDGLTFGHVHACLIEKIRRVANLVLKVLYPQFRPGVFHIEGRDHPSIEFENRSKVRQPPPPKELVLKALEDNNTSGIKFFCKDGVLCQLNEREVEQLWNWAAYQNFDTEILSQLMETFWIEPANIQIAIDEAFTQGVFDNIAEVVIVYHFPRLSDDHQSKIVQWVQRKKKAPIPALHLSSSPPAAPADKTSNLCQNYALLTDGLIAYLTQLKISFKEPSIPGGSPEERIKAYTIQISLLILHLPENLAHEKDQVAIVKECWLRIKAGLDVDRNFEEIFRHMDPHVSENWVDLADFLEETRKYTDTELIEAVERRLVDERSDNMNGFLDGKTLRRIPAPLRLRMMEWGEKCCDPDVLCALIREHLLDKEILNDLAARCNARDTLRQIAGAFDASQLDMLNPENQEAVRAFRLARKDGKEEKIGHTEDHQKYLAFHETFVSGGLEEIDAFLNGPFVEEMDVMQQQAILELATRRETPEILQRVLKHPSFDELNCKAMKMQIKNLLDFKKYDAAGMLMNTSSFRRFDCESCIEIQEMLANSGRDDLIALTAAQFEAALEKR